MTHLTGKSTDEPSENGESPLLRGFALGDSIKESLRRKVLSSVAMETQVRNNIQLVHPNKPKLTNEAVCMRTTAVQRARDDWNAHIQREKQARE
jgi:hypothetical protein